MLVFGARSYVGANLVARLMREAVLVRATARRIEPLEGRNWKRLDIVSADALVPSTLPAALAGVDTAYYLVQATRGEEGAGALDLHAAENFARAAAEAGVRCIVYLGRLFAEDTGSEQLLSRRNVGITLRKGPVPEIELRTGIVIGPGSAAFEILRDLVLKLPVMVTPNWVHRRSSPIALENLLEYLVRLPQVPGALGRVFDAGGPETLTYADMMRSLAGLLGRGRPVIFHAPVSAPRLSARWLWLVTAVPVSVAFLIEKIVLDLFAGSDGFD